MPYPPCPLELRYANREEGNAERYLNRNAGNDSSFYNEPNRLLQAGAMPREMIRVMETNADDTSRGKTPQYRIVNVTQPNTCIHMTQGGSFFVSDHIAETPTCLGSYSQILKGKVYSHDAIWSNMSPTWKWQGAIEPSARRIVRCKIQLDPNTLNKDANVAIDLKPVAQQRCEIDEGVDVKYADVVIPRGTFVVGDVAMYTLDGNQSNERVNHAAEATGEKAKLQYVKVWDSKTDKLTVDSSPDRYAAFLLTSGRREEGFERILVDVTLQALRLEPFRTVASG